MAEKGELQEQRATYQLVLGMMKWGGAASFLIAAMVVWLIAA